MALKGNKGEWSELYVLVKLLAEGKLYQSDVNLERDEENVYDVIKAYKKEIAYSLEFVREQQQLEVYKIVNDQDKELVTSFRYNILTQIAENICEGIINSHQRTFFIQNANDFIQNALITKIKADPSTKADIGDHAKNIDEKKAIGIVGFDVYNEIKTKALEIYKKASEYALTKGIIIADTKMEFGIYNNKVILIDELLTPDSSRFWPLDNYEKGRAQDSYDKQYVRDYLLSINFNKRPPAPILPESVITNTANKYIEAEEKLTGKKLEK